MQRKLGTTSIYVTHDQTEAMTLGGDRVAVLKRGGLLQQVASPRELYEQPVNLFVAGFIGSPSMNFLPAHPVDGKLRTPLGDIPALEHQLKAAEGRDIVLIGVRPEHFEDNKLVDEGVRSKGWTFKADVSHTEWLGNEQYGYISYEPDPKVSGLLNSLAQDLDADELVPMVVTSLEATSRIRGGQQAELWMDVRKLHVFDAESGGENLTRDAEEGARLTAEAAEERAFEIKRAQQEVSA